MISEYFPDDTSEKNELKDVDQLRLVDALGKLLVTEHVSVLVLFVETKDCVGIKAWAKDELAAHFCVLLVQGLHFFVKVLAVKRSVISCMVDFCYLVLSDFILIEEVNNGRINGKSWNRDKFYFQPHVNLWISCINEDIECDEDAIGYSNYKEKCPDLELFQPFWQVHNSVVTSHSEIHQNQLGNVSDNQQPNHKLLAQINWELSIFGFERIFVKLIHPFKVWQNKNGVHKI